LSNNSYNSVSYYGILFQDKIKFHFSLRYISPDNDDLCSEKELFLMLKKELDISDSYRFTDKQKDEVYNLLNCNDDMREKRQLPYKRLLYLLIKTLVQ
jgi:hypothetical protein